MHLTQPKVFMLAKPQLIPEGMEAWLKHLGADQYNWKKSDSDGENIVMAYAKRCYMAFEVGLNPNVKKVREDVQVYLENILKSRHGSVLAHAHYSFAIENVSRVFTGEMNRHSQGMDISEGSMRFISFDDMGLVETTAMREPKDIFDQIATNFVKGVFGKTEEAYLEAMEKMREQGYDGIPFNRKKEVTSLMRRAIGMGISTGGVWTGNIRALRWICETRGQHFAEEEILVVAMLMLHDMMKECPNLFGDFTVDDKGFYAPTYSKV